MPVVAKCMGLAIARMGRMSSRRCGGHTKLMPPTRSVMSRRRCSLLFARHAAWIRVVCSEWRKEGRLGAYPPPARWEFSRANNLEAKSAISSKPNVARTGTPSFHPVKWACKKLVPTYNRKNLETYGVLPKQKQHRKCKGSLQPIQMRF